MRFSILIRMKLTIKVIVLNVIILQKNFILIRMANVMHATMSMHMQIMSGIAKVENATFVEKPVVIILVVQLPLNWMKHSTEQIRNATFVDM